MHVTALRARRRNQSYGHFMNTFEHISCRGLSEEKSELNHRAERDMF